MNQRLKQFFLLTTILLSASTTFTDDNDSSCSTCPTGCTRSQNLWQPKPFSSNAERQIQSIKGAWAQSNDEEGMHGAFSIGFGYESNGGCKSKKHLGSIPFWSSKTTDGVISSTFSNTMTIGSNKSNSDLDVYQMGMGPVTTTGSVTFDPTVFQTGADVTLYIGAHKSERGFWIKAHAPVGLMSMNPNLCHTDSIATVAYPAGALAQTSSGTIAAPYENIAQAFNGQKTTGFLQPMKYGRIECKKTTGARFGDFEFSVGYNVVANEKKHLGVGFIFSAPTGNKAEAHYMLEPIFGNNGHWGAGAEIIGHWKCFESDDNEKHLDVWTNGNVQHLFRSSHMRSFDLKANGAGSRYLLVAKYTNNVFQDSIENAINITTRSVDSTFAVVGNFALGIDFHWRQWSFMMGYEGYGRSCENICLDCTCKNEASLNNYAVIGRQIPFNSGAGALNDLCEPLAKIGSSQAQAAGVTAVTTTIVSATLPANRIPEDDNKALDIDGQRAHALYTSKPFVQLQYTWTDSDYSPFLAMSGGYEVSHRKNSAINMWNVGVQGGLAF